MSDKKHIDRLFQEKLKDFDVAPSDTVWDNIHSQLHKDKERERKVIPFWWKLAGVAAVLALLLTIGIKFISDNSNTTNTVVDTEKSAQPESNGSVKSNNEMENGDIKNQLNTSSSVANGDDSNFGNFSKEPYNTTPEKNQANQNKTSLSGSDKNKIVNNNKLGSQRDGSNDKLSRNDVSSDISTKENKTNPTKDAIANVSSNDENNTNLKNLENEKDKSEIDKLLKGSKNNANTGVTDASNIKEDVGIEDEKEKKVKEEITKDNSIEDAIAEANTENEEEKKLNRWNISPNVAPVYFNSLGKGSALDEQFVNNANSSEVTMSYGVGGSYAINERLKVRAGINKVSLGYSTNNVIAFTKVEPSIAFAPSSNEHEHLTNVNMNSSSENMIFLSSETFDRSATPEVINSKSSGSIKQRFGFIEVPLEMEYAVINKKFEVNVIGGFSTLIVDENEIYSVFDGTETTIGEANNINNMSYSANFGLGINYNISEKIKVNVEPTFKYQINTFSNSSGDFQPYFIGLYTGLSYKF